jgi:MYXO-CTERM domain-containing protein
MIGRSSLWAVVIALTSMSSVAFGATLQVGAGKTYAKPCAAFAAAAAGDIVEIDAGTYTSDACNVGTGKDNLTIRGVGGRPKMDATGYAISNGKAIWVVNSDKITIENIEFMGASVPDMNGAGIRIEAANLTIRNCYFHDNEDGILGGPPADGTGEVLVEYSEFDHNGLGDGCNNGGCTHNMYLNHFAKFTLQYSWSHNVETAHLVKTRAWASYILYNRIGSEGNTTTSIQIDMPNGGLAYVIGNTIQKDASAGNGFLIDFAEEGASNPTQKLYVVGNTLVDGKSSTFIGFPSGTDVSGIVDNIFVGAGTPLSSGTLPAANLVGQDPLFVAATTYDYHLSAGSPAIGKGVDPGTGSGFSLMPVFEYVHPLKAAARKSGGALDLGAFQFGTDTSDAGTVDASGAGGATGAGGSTAAGGSKGTGGAGGSAVGVGGSTANAGTAVLPDGAAPGSPEAAGESSGCGCRTAPATTQHVALLSALAVLAGLARRRRPRSS